jgi:superfamily II DNA or RNA helicase
MTPGTKSGGGAEKDKHSAGTGRTTFSVMATLQQLETLENQVDVLVVCHSRELAIQIYNTYECLYKHEARSTKHECDRILQDTCKAFHQCVIYSTSNVVLIHIFSSRHASRCTMFNKYS